MRIALYGRMIAAFSMLWPLANASGQRLLVLPFPDVSGRVEHVESMRLQRVLGERSRVLGISLVPREDLDAVLSASGFPSVMRWLPTDAHAIATLARADEILLGSIWPEGAAFRVVFRLHLQRDKSLRQPLVASVFASVSAGIDRVVDAFARSRMQLPGELACNEAVRAGDYATAEAAARGAVRDYPTRTIARVCLWNAAKARGTQPSALLSQAREIVALDSGNPIGLMMLASSLRSTGHSDAADSIDVRLGVGRPSRDHVQSVWEWNSPSEALVIVDSVVALNPGDPELHRLRWMLLLVTRQHRRAIAEGESLAAKDTSFADTTYFIRQSYAHEALGQRVQALVLIDRGLAKFPGYPMLLDRKRVLSR